MQHDNHAAHSSNAPTIQNIAKMLVGAGVGVGAVVSGFYFTYLIVVYLQTY